MKKVSILFVSAIALFLTSCSKDDNNSSSAESIEGKWNYSKMSMTSNGQTTPETDYDDNETGCSKDYLEIKTGGVFDEGDYTSGCAFTKYSGTWTKVENFYTFVSSGNSEIYELVSVTSTELKFRIGETVGGLVFYTNYTLTKA